MLIEVKVAHVLQATLLAWHRKAGERVARGDPLVDVESDKVALAITAPETGVIAAILKPEGAPVASGEVIATIETSGTSAAHT